MDVTGTLISYYFYCHRRLWLHANQIQFEDNSEDVAIGRIIEESSYKERPNRYQQISLGSIKIDFYDVKNKVIHEIKKSNKFHETHIWQIKYYIYTLEQVGIEGVVGILEYPKLRKTENVILNNIDKERIVELENYIRGITNKDICPKLVKTSKCKNCSYNDFCYATENIEL